MFCLVPVRKGYRASRHIVLSPSNGRTNQGSRDSQYMRDLYDWRLARWKRKKCSTPRGGQGKQVALHHKLGRIFPIIQRNSTIAYARQRFIQKL
jgi:hypothetical protein